MSLRHYLFSLIGALILLLTLVQLFLVYWIDRNLAQEVNEQAKLLSERVVEFAFNDVEIHVEELSGEQARVIHLPAGNKQTKMVIVPDDNEPFETNVHVFKEKIEIDEESSLKHADKVLVKKRLAKLFESLEQGESNGATTFVQKHPDSHGFSFEHSVTTSETSQSLIHSIQLMILVCALLALIFAYWLSAQFNKPLSALKKGFEALANQDYSYRIKPQGVNEIKQTMVQFNAMLSTLGELKQVEQHYKETAHLAELGEVSRGLAHTLRNPIHTIGLSIERLANNHLTESQRVELVHTIQAKIAHIDNNIKSLLTLTTNGIERDQNVPVLAVIQDIVLEFKSAQVKPQRFDIDVSINLHITGAESEIRSILHTLIINACEANPEDGTVIINAKEQSNCIAVAVKDEGKGLDDAIAQRLFQPHVSSKPEGAGMGLYIAKRITTLHYAGNISLENRVDHHGCIATAIFSH
ncbi:HAMP domain-containing histidine kinase [Thalassotalea sp. M1531]|uniref:histidine kinase n=1 Tax=Thalassotalea algicola TaxID=2716224 RepID=A0A7Y0LH32_9GAMM|nr:HAMP domain-containing sensor histidine kinase [Thalassotalea algicola]NMP33115.1 HAMP domain-containing histidine kinase [Thalassotalea algicola]